MSQLSIKLSDKADALIAQLQKEIFNRRRKKVTAAGVVETLVESGARSQSDKRFSTSWTNLIKDIEKAAKLANAHGSKPTSLTDAEWAMVLSHRQRAAVGVGSKPASRKRTTSVSKAKAAPKAKGATKAGTARKTVSSASSAKTAVKSTKSAVAKSSSAKTAATKAAATKTVRKAATTTTTSAASATRKPRPAKRARKSSTGSPTTSVAKRMAKAAGRLSSSSLSSSGISSPARS